MKLRMYLRGLGLGMIITAIVLSFALPKDNKMSDADVKKRAEELGMVEEGSTLVQAAEPQLTETIEENAVDNNETIIEEKAEEIVSEDSAKENLVDEKEEILPESTAAEDDATVEKAEDEAIDKENVAEEKEEIKEDSKKEEKEEVKEEKKEEVKEEIKKKGPVTINIKGGSSSDVVAKQLEKEGAVDSASKFDAYLCRNGYDKRIVTGNHEIPEGASYQTIANIITSTK